MSPAPLLYWFRKDLRLSDQPGLLAALKSGHPVIPLYIYDTSEDIRPYGGASRWWLHHSLQALADDLAARGSRLVLRRGPAEEVLHALIAETGAAGVYWGRCYEPYAIARDTRLKAALLSAGLKAESFNTALLFEPWTITNKAGNPFQVFTPFWKTCLAQGAFELPLPAPEALPSHTVQSDTLSDWGLLPTKPNWAEGFAKVWQPGAAGAQQSLTTFLNGPINIYSLGRDTPHGRTTSRLSPHLQWGEISPREIVHAIGVAVMAGHITSEADSDAYVRELGWREFAHHLLYHFPHLPHTPLNARFKAFPWHEDAEGLRAWQRGLTGYPIVDAGLRELWQTGWMHNRVRMIVGSFLVKDLLLPWQQGEAWFWDTLLDADLANNTTGWQWIAGCGADAAPYFRIFNPVLQGEKFDPDGHYVRTYVPELKALPREYIHRPWEAPEAVRARAGVVLGRDYPQPIVDHTKARNRALAALAHLKEENGLG